MTDKRKDCPMRHENGNCTVAGGFCTAVNDPICEALHSAFDCGYRSAIRQQEAVTDRHQMTNADLIRSMSDEELTEFLCNFRTCDATDEHPCIGCKAEQYCRVGHTGAIDWLQLPAEEDDHA